MKNTQSSQHSVDQISFKGAALAIVGIVVVVVVAILFALYFNNQRKERIVQQYDQETQVFVGAHQQQISDFFASTYDSCGQELAAKQASSSATYPERDVICSVAQEKLAEMQVDQLKDSSAIAYIRYQEGDYELIEASGKYTQKQSLIDPSNYSQFSYSLEKRTELNQYLKGEKQIDRWQDFMYYIPGKEVVVPVSINDNTIGFIFRGVIEK